MHAATTRRRQGDWEYTTTLLRQSYRENGKARHRTLANPSRLAHETVELVRASLKGTSLVAIGEALVTIHSLPHGEWLRCGVRAEGDHREYERGDARSGEGTDVG